MPIRNFPFSVTSPTDVFPRPWLPIKIINPHTGQSIKFFGLIDTGADACSIPAPLAPLLGHDLTKGTARPSKTAGGPATGYSHTTKIEIYDLHDKLLYTINDTPIDFMPGLHVPLLGVNRFLDHFELHIHYPAKKFSIKWPSPFISCIIRIAKIFSWTK